MVVSGLLNKQVGGELGISEITVKAHRGQVMRKMQAGSLPDLVRMAAQLELTVRIPGLTGRGPLSLGEQPDRGPVDGRSTRLRLFHVERGICRRIVRSSAVLARNDVCGVPLRPVVFQSGRLVPAVALFRFAQKIGQRHDVRA